MVNKYLRYKKKRICVVKIHQREHLFIEGECIPASQLKNKGPYTSTVLPYQTFKSLHDLAKAVIDYRNSGSRSNRNDRQYWYI